MILTGIAVAVALRELAVVLVPLALALFLSYGLIPLIDYQARTFRLPRLIAVATTTVIGVAFLFLLFQIGASSLNQLDRKRDVYERRVNELISWSTNFLRERKLLGIIAPWTETGESRAATDARTEKGAPAETPDAKPKKSELTFAQRFGGAIRSLLIGLSSAGAQILSQAFLVLTFMMFFLFGRSIGHAPMGSIWRDVEQKVKRYISTKVSLSMLTASLVWLTLTVLRVELALGFAMLTFLLNFIPNIGSIIAVMVPLPFALLDANLSITAKVLVFVIPLAIQVSIGNFLEPKLMGNSFDLHPVTVLVALIFWGILWGFVGMFLAVPMTAVLKLCLERLEVTRPFARMLAGRMIQP